MLLRLRSLGTCVPRIIIELQLALCRREDSEGSEFGEIIESDEDFFPDPLCSIPHGIDWNHKSSYWVLRKVDEIKDCVGISCDGFEELFSALLIAIEAGQSSLARSASKRERELKRLWIFWIWLISWVARSHRYL